MLLATFLIGTLVQLAHTLRQAVRKLACTTRQYKQVYRYRRVAKNILLYSLYWVEIASMVDIFLSVA